MLYGLPAIRCRNYFTHGLRFLAIAALALAPACKQGKPSSAQKPAALSRSEHAYAILPNAIVLNHKEATFPLTYATLAAMLGKPSRTIKDKNTLNEPYAVYIWDSLGVTALQMTNYSRQCISVNFRFARVRDNFAESAKGLFGGSVLVDDFPISKETKLKDIKKAGISDQQGWSFWERKLGRTLVQVHYDDEHGGVQKVSCLDVKWYKGK